MNVLFAILWVLFWLLGFATEIDYEEESKAKDKWERADCGIYKSDAP